MKIWIVLLACAALLLPWIPAAAADTVTVWVRVEGIRDCLYYGDIRLDAGGTAAQAAQRINEVMPELDIQGIDGGYITSIGGETAGSFGGWDGWNYCVNGVPAAVGINDCLLEDGDELVFYYAGYPCQIPIIDISQADKGIVTFTSNDTTYDENGNPSTTRNPIVGATVNWGFSVYTTDDSGSIYLSEADRIPGEHGWQITKTGDVNDDGDGLPLVLRTAYDDYVTIYGKGEQSKAAADGALNRLCGDDGSVAAGDDWTALMFARLYPGLNKPLTKYREDAEARMKRWAADPADATPAAVAKTLLAAAALVPEQAADCYRAVKTTLFTAEKLESGGLAVLCYGLLAAQNFDRDTEALVAALIAAQLPDGGFALSGDTADIDMTAIAIQALARFKSEKTVQPVLTKATGCLAARQLENGGFSSYGIESAESCAQVIIALCAVGIDPASDPAFVKGESNALTALMAYQLEDGGFAHTSGGDEDAMATVQAAAALTAFWRHQNGMDSYYIVTAPEPSAIPWPLIIIGGSGILTIAGGLAVFIIRRKKNRAA